MSHPTVRITKAAHDTLRELAREEGKPMQALLEEAVEALRRKRFLEQVNAAYAVLRTDPATWSDVDRERREWDVTLLDGLAARCGPSPGIGSAHAGASWPHPR